MHGRLVSAMLVTLAVAGCATPQTGLGLDGQRSVFHNPYAPVVIDHGPVGPEQCGGCPDGVWIDGFFYPGRGAYAYDRYGTRILLSRQERRQARERYRQISALIEQNRAIEQFNAAKAGALPPPPIPSAPPIASQGPSAERTAGNDRGGSSAPPPVRLPGNREPF